jgi:hypothetical protein
MANSEKTMLPSVPVGALKRPFFEKGNYLATDDLLTEQRYRSQRLRRHNRHLHGWGVVCGLGVVPARDPARPWAVWVCPGYAIGPYSDEINVPARALLDIRDYLWTRPRVDSRWARLAYISIRYDEEPVHPLPTMPRACGCQDSIYVPSRIRDGFRVDVLWILPKARSEEFDMCAPQLAPCPDCPDSPYVPLARVTLPASESDPIAAGHIDSWGVRRWLYPTSVIQRQLVACCCH